MRVGLSCRPGAGISWAPPTPSEGGPRDQVWERGPPGERLLIGETEEAGGRTDPEGSMLGEEQGVCKER